MEAKQDYEKKEFEGVEFRYVRPYDYNYITHCKERWRNRTIISVFLNEFKAYSEEYYREAITSGNIQVNNLQVTSDYILRNGDTITHSALRNEPPVLSTPIKILYDLPNLLIVNKPSSLPVHPSGAYYKNSLIHILEFEMGYKSLHLIHRLDRVTSGILILAKNPQIAAKVTKLFQSHSTQKYYIARVKGNFPYKEKEVNEKILCISHKEGIYIVDDKGKDSTTFIRKIFYDPISHQSVVECQPITGRTHQIRVHLKFLGYPIANDVCYGGENISPIESPDNLYKLQFGNKKIHLEATKQMQIWLHSFRYVLTQNLNFCTELPDWALNKYGS
jgi:RluA family pseudouridine synthase